MSAEIVSKIRAIGGAGRMRTALDIGASPGLREVGRAEHAATLFGGARVGAGHAGSAPRVVAIAASTGGPNALSEVLSGLGRDFAIPILITQHMPPLFTGLLAQRLARDAGRECVEARDGDVIRSGCSYVAPGDHHMMVVTHEGRPFVRLAQSPPENHCRPAADVTLRSVAAVYGAGSLAVVLTGMGEDGRRGCEAIRAAGGRVVAQDEATSVVWGMPGAVVHAGLANWVLPLPDVAQRICTLAVATVQ